MKHFRWCCDYVQSIRVINKRANGKAADVNLADFFHSLDNYLPKLVNAGYRVAICEQIENPKQGKEL